MPDRRLALNLIGVIALAAVCYLLKIGSPASVTIPAAAPNVLAVNSAIDC